MSRSTATASGLSASDWQSLAAAAFSAAGLGTSVRVHFRQDLLGLVEGRSTADHWRFELLVDNRLAGVRRRGSPLPGFGRSDLEALVSAACEGEIGLWRFCPYDSDWMAVILDGIAEGVHASDPPVDDLDRIIRRVAGLFCRFVANACVAQWGPADRRATFRQGHVVRTRAVCSESDRVPADVLALLALEQWTVMGRSVPDNKEARAALLRRVRSDKVGPRVRKAIRKIVRNLGLVGPSTRRIARAGAAAVVLSDRSHWRERARAFAEACAPLVDGTQGLAGTDVVSRFLGGAEGGRAARSLSRRRIPSGAPSAVSAEVADGLYWARGVEIALACDPVRAESGGTFPVSWLSVRPYGEGEPVSSTDLALSATRLRPDASGGFALELFRRDRPLFEKVRTRARVFPDLAWLVDSSESMSWDPLAAADRGKFDRLLQTVYGTWRWLERSGLADALNYAAVNFSSRTICSGWYRWHKRQSLSSVILTHQGNETRVDVRKTLDSLLPARRPFVAIVITDGEFDNPGQPVELFDALRQAGHLPLLVEVGSAPSDSARTLAAQGFECHHVPEARGLDRLTLGTLLPQHLFQ